MSSSHAAAHRHALAHLRAASRHAVAGRLKAPDSRTAGLLLVVLVHVLILMALVKGLHRQVTPPPPPIQLSMVDRPTPPPPTVKPLTPQLPPVAPTLTPRWIDPPPVQVEPTVSTPPLATATSETTTEAAITPSTAIGTQAGTTSAAGSAAAAAAASSSETVLPGAICTAMASPTMPAVQWSGEALFRVVADVRASRVVAVQIQAVQGAMDARTRRAFAHAIDSTLKERYVCPGDHRFQQEFSFRVE